MGANARVGREHVAQAHALVHRSSGRFLQQLMGLHPANLRAERHRDRLGKYEPAGELKVGRHARGVDLQTFDDGNRLRQRPGAERADLRQGFPFGVPAAEAALVFLHHRREHDRDQRRRSHRRGEDDGASDRVALVRHGGGAAASGRTGLGGFAHLGLHQQRHVARELAQRSDQKAQGGSDFGQPIALRMPGNVG